MMPEPVVCLVAQLVLAGVKVTELERVPADAFLIEVLKVVVPTASELLARTSTWTTLIVSEADSPEESRL